MHASFYQYLVAGALIANAIIGHILYRSAFADAGRQPVLAATVLAIVVAALAVQIMLRPRPWALQLARGAAAGMLLGLVGIALLTFVAANFESGMSSSALQETFAFVFGLFIIQVAIIVGSARIEHVSLAESFGTIPGGAFRFWLIVVGVHVAATMVEGLTP